MCWGDTGLLLSMPRQGLGNSAIASVADAEQQERYGGMWAAMAITEPEHRLGLRQHLHHGRPDGDEYVINGEKIFVTSGERADSVVVWATLDKSLGRAAIKSFVVRKDNPGMKVERLEHKLGIRASDTAVDHVHRLPGARREPARLARRSTSRRASPARWRPSTTPAPWWPRWPSGAPARPST